MDFLYPSSIQTTEDIHISIMHPLFAVTMSVT